MTSTHNSNTVADGRNANQSEIVAFLLASAEKMQPHPVPHELWFSTKQWPVQAEPTEQLCQFALASHSRDEVIGILAELRRRLDLMKGEMQ